jgi:hypothetical protein
LLKEISQNSVKDGRHNLIIAAKFHSFKVWHQEEISEEEMNISKALQWIEMAKAVLN